MKSYVRACWKSFVLVTSMSIRSGFVTTVRSSKLDSLQKRPIHSKLWRTTTPWACRQRAYIMDQGLVTRFFAVLRPVGVGRRQDDSGALHREDAKRSIELIKLVTCHREKTAPHVLLLPSQPRPPSKPSHWSCKPRVPYFASGPSGRHCWSGNRLVVISTIRRHQATRGGRSRPPHGGFSTIAKRKGVR